MKKILFSANLTEELVCVLEKAHGIDIEISGFFVKPEYFNNCSRINDLIPKYAMTFDLKKSKSTFNLDSLLLDDFYKNCASDVFYLIDRLLNNDNLTGNTFRTNYIYNYINYIGEILLETKPEIVIFNSTPHNAQHLILYWLSKYYGIKTIIIYCFFMDKNYFSYVEDYKIGDLRLKNEYQSLLKSNDDVELSQLKFYFNKLRGTYDEAIPEYEKINKTKGYNISVSKINKRRLVDYINIKIIQYKRNKLFKYYKSKTIEKIDKKYIVLGLHYQPERTSMPEGGYFANFWLVVKMLSESLPKDWILIIKEHPSVFTRKIINTKLFRYRSKSFYDTLTNFDNVSLIKIDYDTFNLIDNAESVVTLTGVIGIEALIRGKKVLSFGHSIYKHCEGVFNISSQDDLISAIQDIQNSNSIDIKYSKYYLKAFENIFIGNVNGEKLTFSEGYSLVLQSLIDKKLL